MKAAWRWSETEHVLAGPFADLLRRACDEEREVAGGQTFRLRHFDSGKAHVQTTTSRTLWERRYAARYGTTTRTAARHFSLVLNQPTIPLVIADRVSALLGVPFAYIEAMA